MSFFSDIANKLTRPKQVFGIHIHSDGDDSSFTLVELTRKKSSVLLVKQSEFSLLEEAIDELPKGSVVGLRITGKGVLSRTFEGQFESHQLLSKILPNADPNDFYLQDFIDQDTTHAAVVRKDVLDNYLEKFSNHFVTTIELGQGAEIVLNEILDLPKSESDKLPVGDQTLSFRFVPCFSVAFKALLGIEEATLDTNTVHHSKDEYTQKQLFQLGGVTLLGLSLILLLANFILFQNYRNANAELSDEASKFTQVNARKDSLASVLVQREDFLSKSGWMKNMALSKQLDALASNMPKELLLDEISFFPLDEKASREKHKNQYEADKVIIKGTTSNTVHLNEWINDINKMPNMASTEIIEYEYDSRKKVGLFKLAVQVQ